MKAALRAPLGVVALLAVSTDTRLVTVVPLSHDWDLVEGKYWHIESSHVEAPSVTDALEKNRGECPIGMVEVSGRMKVLGDDEILDELQRTTCTSWISREFPERCAVYDESRWLELSRNLPTRAMHFCIDRFEYPNRKGDYPVIAVTWSEAAGLCAERGERLCSEEEWDFACEGENAQPYPNGFVRDDAACVMDRPYRVPDPLALSPRNSPAALAELDRLWQGEASGSRPRCRSPFGVYDMTGNVDEWTRSTRIEGRLSILKGGYWGPVRTRCLPSTRAHGDGYYFYQEGFRCCADAPHARIASPNPGG